MVVYAAASHPLTRKKRVALAEVAAERWALTETVLQPYRLLERAFHQHGLPSPRTAMESRSSRIRFASIACSDLLGYTSTLAFRHIAARYKLKEIRVKELERRRAVGVMYRQGAYLSPAARRLIGILKSSAPALK